MGKDFHIAAGHPAEHAGRPHLPFVEVMLRLWRAYWRWRCREATVRLLRSMDERRLRDIGVDPKDLSSLSQDRDASVRNHSFWGNP